MPCDCCRKLHCLDQVNEGQGGQQGREKGISKHLAMQCNVSHSLCLSCECAGVANFLVGLLKGYKYMEQRQSTLKCANIKRGATKSTVSVEMRKDEQRRQQQQHRWQMPKDPAHFEHTMARCVSLNAKYALLKRYNTLYTYIHTYTDHGVL